MCRVTVQKSESLYLICPVQEVSVLFLFLFCFVTSMFRKVFAVSQASKLRSSGDIFLLFFWFRYEPVGFYHSVFELVQ